MNFVPFKRSVPFGLAQVRLVNVLAQLRGRTLVFSNLEPTAFHFDIIMPFDCSKDV